MFKVRLGILLIVLSWIPFAQIIIYIAHHNQQFMSDSSAETVRLIVWGVQIIIGFIGLWLVGKVAFDAAKRDGWKHTPNNIWKLFWDSDNKD